MPDELISVIREHRVDIYSDEVAELHIPPQDITISSISRSLKRLKEYLRHNSKERRIPKYIYGITYLASFAERYWFNIIDLPDSIKESSGAARLLATYNQSNKDTKKQKISNRFNQGDIKLCYISTDELLGESSDEDNVSKRQEVKTRIWEYSASVRGILSI